MQSPPDAPVPPARLPSPRTPRAIRALVRLAAVVLAVCALGCRKDDDDPPRATPPPTPAAPPTMAAVTAEPPPGEPPPGGPPQGGPPATPPPSTARPAGSGGGAKKKDPAAPQIPTQFVPEPLRPLVPKIPAALPL